jgi:hypothetical protein
VASYDPPSAGGEDAETLDHPVFGPLQWQPDTEYWFGSHCLPTGEQLDLIIEPLDEDRHAFLERAIELFHRALANERRILRVAMKEELLELYNDCWRQSDEPVLSAKELTQILDWLALSLSASEFAPVEFSYGADDLFGGHFVVIHADDQMQYRDVDLNG